MTDLHHRWWWLEGFKTTRHGREVGILRAIPPTSHRTEAHAWTEGWVAGWA